MTHRIYSMSFASVYPHYVAKAEKGLKRTVRANSAGFDPGRAKEQVDEIIRWLTGFSQAELEAEIARKTDFETFFAKAPRLNPARDQIKGLICGQRVEEIEEPLMREIRYMDKLIDDQPFRHAGGMSAMRLMARGKKMEKILR